MSINLTDEIEVKTKKGKLGAAKQIFLEGDTTSLQKAHEDNQAHLGTLDNRSTQIEESLKNIAATGGASDANAVFYDHKASGLTAINVKGALDELAINDRHQDIEISKKANSADVTSQIQIEQNRVNTELSKKFDKTSVVQELGESEDEVVSQKVVSTRFNDLSSAIDEQQYNCSVPKSKNLLETDICKKFIGYVDNQCFIQQSGCVHNKDWLSVIIPVSYNVSMNLCINTRFPNHNNVTSLAFFENLSSKGSVIEYTEGTQFEYTPTKDGYIIISAYKDTSSIFLTYKNGYRYLYSFGSIIYYDTILHNLKNGKVDKSAISQNFGNAEDKIISQKAISNELSSLKELVRNEYAVAKGTNLVNLQTSKVFLGYVSNDLFILNGFSGWGREWNSIMVPVNKGITLSMYIETTIKQAEVTPLSFFSVSSLNKGKKIECNEGEEFEYTPDEDGFIVISTFKNTCKIIQKSSTKYYFGSSYYYIRELKDCSNRTYINSTNIDKIKVELDEITKPTTKQDLDIIQIPYLFSVVNPALYSREYVTRVFPESFIKSKPSCTILINGNRSYAINRQKKSNTLYEKKQHSIILEGSDYNTTEIKVDVHYENELIFDNDKNVRLCLFGVSFDALDYKNKNGQVEEGGSKTACILEKYVRMGGKDNNFERKFVSIGTNSHSGGDSFSYNGEVLSCRGRSECRSGNNAICYLRQPMNFSPTNISYDSNVNNTEATGIIQWLMNGLRFRIPYNKKYNENGTNYGDFEKTKEKIDALRCTPFGKYHWNYDKKLWDFCNKKGWIKTVGGTYSEWVANTYQKEITDKCMEYIANHPDYPWFSLNKARETSYNSDNEPKDITDNTQYSFDFTVYMSRYRTMDNNGVRLAISDENPSGKQVTGSDGKSYNIGSEITSQALLKNYDVCSPSHVIWDMNFNNWGYYADWGQFNTAVDAEELNTLFVNIIKEQIGDIFIGLKSKKSNGAFFPNVWSDIALGQNYKGNDFLVSQTGKLISDYSNLDNKASWIPVFPVSLPFASNFQQEFEDFAFGKCLVNSGDNYSSTSDNTHEGLLSSKAMTYQIYGWLLHTLHSEL